MFQCTQYNLDLDMEVPKSCLFPALYCDLLQQAFSVFSLKRVHNKMASYLLFWRKNYLDWG